MNMPVEKKEYQHENVSNSECGFRVGNHRTATAQKYSPTVSQEKGGQ